MTRPRVPISIDTALARIAGQLPNGWGQMAIITGYQPRTVRAWGDEDRDEQVNLRAAIKLDVAFQEHGGIGSPIYEAYGDLVRAARAEQFGCKQQLQRATMDFMKDNGEAELALLEATMPDAGPAEKEAALREVLEVRAAADKIALSLSDRPP